MNLMEFKIAVVGNHMFGDIGLIINDPKRPPQLEKGFQDADLYGILHGPPVAHGKMFSPITIERNGQSLVFSNIKELAE